jgi:hypothetical protein
VASRTFLVIDGLAALGLVVGVDAVPDGTRLRGSGLLRMCVAVGGGGDGRDGEETKGEKRTRVRSTDGHDTAYSCVMTVEA